jgi:hypothetical protein
MYTFLVVTDFYEGERKELGELEKLYGVFLLIGKIGICGAFNVIYCSFAEMFPPLFSITAFAIANFMARSSAFFAP